MIPTIVGQSKLAPGKLGESSSSASYGATFLGFEALRRSTQLSLKYPMEHGIVMEWDDITKLIKYSVKDCLKMELESLTSGLMITESPLNPKRHRERMAQLAFEELEVPKFQISMNSLNALYSEALTSGLVFECGEGLSTCVPIVDGYILSHAIQKFDIGGRDVNEYLMELLKPKTLFTTSFEREFVRDIKEQCCFIKL
jgi:actin-related protein